MSEIHSYLIEVLATSEEFLRKGEELAKTCFKLIKALNKSGLEEQTHNLELELAELKNNIKVYSQASLEYNKMVENKYSEMEVGELLRLKNAYYSIERTSFQDKELEAINKELNKRPRIIEKKDSFFGTISRRETTWGAIEL